MFLLYKNNKIFIQNSHVLPFSNKSNNAMELKLNNLKDKFNGINNGTAKASRAMQNIVGSNLIDMYKDK